MNAEPDINGSVGTIYDYQAYVQRRDVISESHAQSYDSADSYAAVFLILLWEYYDQYRDAGILDANKEKIDQLVDLLLSLQTGGYTETIQGSGIKYLMDNAEVYCGLQCAFRLYDTLWAEENRTQMIADAVSLFQYDFECIWWSGEYYYCVLNGNNQPYFGEEMDWEKLYELAVPQLFPVIFAIETPEDEKSRQVYSRFCQQWNWTTMEYDDQTWSLIVYAAAIMEDYDSVDKFLETGIMNFVFMGMPKLENAFCIKISVPLPFSLRINHSSQQTQWGARHYKCLFLVLLSL